jgi:hypothetical protein
MDGLNNPCRLLEKLFDTLVTPILTYDSEVWDVDSTFKDSDPFEKLHIKFTNVSEILGIHCKASNDAQTSLPYVRIGVTKESNIFSRSPHGLLRPMVFLILK